MESRELEQLAESRERFLAFVRRRVADPELAEDIVQSSLVRAVQRFDTLEDRQKLVPWFYATLRNAITDSYRNRARVIEVELPETLDIEDEPERQRQLCECFRALIPTLRGEYAEVIESLDLRDEPAALTAERLAITPNNLKVRHHRARQALRRKLEETCRVCAEHHCMDCTCKADSEASNKFEERV